MINIFQIIIIIISRKMAIQDKFDNIEEIKEICDKAINTKKKINKINKSDKNYGKLCEKIAKYNVILLEKFDLLDKSDKTKIYISFGTNSININSFNNINADNFGNIIDLILKSWIIIAWDKNLSTINLPNGIKKNIIMNNNINMEDNLRINHNISKENNISNQKLDSNDIEKEFIENIYGKIKILNKNVYKWKIKYKLNAIRKISDNFNEFKRYNNWFNSPLLVHKRSYSYNKSKFKEFTNNGNIYSKFMKASYSNNINNIQIILNNNDIRFIKQFSKTFGIKIDNITGWFRNKYPIDYINKFNFVKNQYNLINEKYNFHIQEKRLDTDTTNANTNIIDICSLRNNIDIYDL